VTGHFVFFVVRTFRNMLVRQARRLRSPRYAIAALVGALYFFFIFGGWTLGDGVSGTWLGMVRNLGPLGLAGFASWWWLWGGHRHGLILTPAETHLLLPAPLTRSELVRFKIMTAQPAIMFSAVIGTLVMRGTGLLWPLRFLSLWMLLATLHQHQIAASLVHAGAEQHGRRGLRSSIVPMAVFGIAFMTLVWSLFGAVVDIRVAGLQSAPSRLASLLEEPGPSIVLAPFRLLLAPLVATSLADWLLPSAAAGIVLLAHYLWVVRTDAAFEETAIAEGERRETMAAAVRSGGFSRMKFAQRDRTKKLARPWLPLRPTGRNAFAIFWKNVLYSQRSMTSMRLVIPIVFIALIVSISSGGGGDALRFVGIVLLSLAVAISVFGPFGVRNDLRTDLKHIDLLRTYPLPGRELVAAEIAAATVTLTVPQFLLIAAGTAVMILSGVFDAATAAVVIAAAVLVLPVVNALALLIQNTLALLYPSWIRLGEHGGGGMESIGQNMIVMTGTLLLLVICAIPPLLAGAMVGAPLALLIGQGAVLAGVAAALLAAAAEVALFALWLGRLYDRTDPVMAGLLR
jgi:ABC-2 type transport system permease protein